MDLCTVRTWVHAPMSCGTTAMHTPDCWMFSRVGNLLRNLFTKIREVKHYLRRTNHYRIFKCAGTLPSELKIILAALWNRTEQKESKFLALLNQKRLGEPWGLCSKNGKCQRINFLAAFSRRSAHYVVKWTPVDVRSLSISASLSLKESCFCSWGPLGERSCMPRAKGHILKIDINDMWRFNTVTFVMHKG